jgi:hypothetical protein
MKNSQRILIPWEEVKPLVHEADIFLFRSTCWYSWFIQRFTQSEYSHVALASWHNGDNSLLELIEFHGFRGGGAVINADTYFPSEKGHIDIYRPSSHYDKIWLNPTTREIESKIIQLQPKAITKKMRILTGMPYGWKRMWWFAKRYLVGLRLFYDLEDLTSDEIEDIVYPVCSTAVSYAFSSYEYDLMKNKGDEWTKPSDVSESTLLHYICTPI